MVSAAIMHISASAAMRAAAHRVGIELHELAEAARAGLLVAEHPAEAVAAIGLRQRVEILRDVARQRRGQVVAQRQPLLVVVLEREHALVRPVLVGQELAERVGVFDRRRLHRLEAVALDRRRGSRRSCAGWRRSRPDRGRQARAAAAPSVGWILSAITVLHRSCYIDSRAVVAAGSCSGKGPAREPTRRATMPPGPSIIGSDLPTTSNPIGCRSRPTARSRPRRG